jgi:hypothetical protein
VKEKTVAKTFKDLTPAQKSDYEAELARLGCREHKGTVKPRSGKGPILLSSDPEESAILPYFIEVHSLDELKRLGGIPDEHFAKNKIKAADFGLPQKSTINLAAQDLRELSSAEVQELVTAGRAYVLGPSHAVAQYKEIFERLFMPAPVAVFSGENVIVTKDHPLVFSGPNPVVANFGTITVEPGGQIRLQTNVTLTAQELHQVGANGKLSAGDFTGQTVTSLGTMGATGATGGAGGIGSQGTPGSPGVDGKSSCDTQATMGGTGNPGTPGGDGGGGGTGGDANAGQFTLGVITGGLSVLTSGGNGGPGGPAGKGGQGGAGGPGGAATNQCGAGPQGAGGNGGPGGNGGSGGAAGAGAVLYIKYTTLQGDVSTQTPQGVGGAGGAGGPGGTPGTGSTAGGAGASGKPGAAGAAGKQGQVIVQPV